jgi:tetratricopeptide (TPR) repeat protein
MSKWHRLLGVVLLSGMALCSGCWIKPLRIEISAPKERFVQAEPVPIRVEITNHSEKDVEVVSNLRPEYLILRFRVTDPEGRSWIPEPSAEYMIEGYEKMTLSSGDKLVWAALLPFGADRSVFNKIGKYKVEALYDPEGRNKPLSSEPITITVVKPDGVDRQAQGLFMGREQGELASGRGASQTAVESFYRILREYPRSRFAPYAAYYLGSYHLGQRERKEALELFERILRDYKDFALSANVRYELSLAYTATGNKGQARKCLNELISKEPSDLAARRAEKVLRELESE